MRETTIGHVLAHAFAPDVVRAAQEERAYEEAQLHSAAKVALAVAQAMDDVTALDALDVMAQLPNNMLDLLHSPEGWVAMAAYISQGAVVLPMPVRH